MKIVKLTDEQWNTVYTALRLERERFWGKDEETVNLIQNTLNAVCDYKEEN